MRSHCYGKKKPLGPALGPTGHDEFTDFAESNGSTPDFGFTTSFSYFYPNHFKMLQLVRILMASAGQDKVRDLFATEPDY